MVILLFWYKNYKETGTDVIVLPAIVTNVNECPLQKSMLSE